MKKKIEQEYKAFWQMFKEQTLFLIYICLSFQTLLCIWQFQKTLTLVWPGLAHIKVRKSQAVDLTTLDLPNQNIHICNQAYIYFYRDLLIALIYTSD